jgi:hypothetical protein
MYTVSRRTVGSILLKKQRSFLLYIHILS